MLQKVHPLRELHRLYNKYLNKTFILNLSTEAFSLLSPYLSEGCENVFFSLCTSTLPYMKLCLT